MVQAVRRGILGRRFAALVAVAASTALIAAPAQAADHDITVLSSQQLDSRLVQLQLSTPALKAPTGVRVLLPAGYDQNPDQRYPVLYLLHGAQGNYTNWTTVGDAEATTAGAPMIVVMPDGGQGGFYTNWVNRQAYGPPEWETYHIDELIPWIDDHYRTIAARDGRAIAGLSMGGFGAMSYAARHPDLFDWAGSFSGAVDITHSLGAAGAIAAVAFLDGGLPGDQFGNRLLMDLNWQAHDPWVQAPHLRGMTIQIDTGNGAPGPYDGSPLGDPIEEQVHEMSVSLHNRLLSLGIPHTWDDYGPGTHTWPYWQRDLRQAVPSVLATLAGPAG
jgi:S-formylglutathione hydrolase FrmB